MPAKRYSSLLLLAFNHWRQDHASWLAAALAYYTLFSFIPLLIIIVTIASHTFGPSALRGDVSYYLGLYLNDGIANWIESIIVDAYQPQGNIQGTLFTTGLLIIGASGFLFHLKQAFHQIWGVPKSQQNIIVFQVYERIISLLLIISLSLVFILSLTISASLASIVALLSTIIPVQDVTIFQGIENLLTFLIVTTIVAFIYKVLPDVEVPWSAAFRGAMLSSLLFIIGKLILGFYMAFSTITTTYGAASSLVAFLLWVYYSAQILLIGAEFTKVYSQKS